MARKRLEHPPVHRTDLLPSNLTAGKRTKVLDLLAHYRAGAVLLGREQWRLFFEGGRFNKNYDVDKTTFAAAIGAANRVQMCRYQVFGQLQGWISNRANEFRDAVNRSSLPPDTRHMLHVINRRGAWFLRADVAMRGTGEIIPDDVRRLARSIMRHVMCRHRRPDLSRISMRLDHRAACLATPTKATQGGKVGWWVNLSTMEPGRKIAVPLLTYDYHAKRPGRVTNGVQVNLNREGWLTFGVVTDMGEAYTKSRADYDGHGVLALDFGLSTLFATSEGQLLGQGWLKRLRAYDREISDIARGVQRRGGKPRDNARYREAVAALRGFLRTEIGHVLNRLVEQGRPKELVLERLDFRNPDLSRRMNAILRNCGRSIIQSKLATSNSGSEWWPPRSIRPTRARPARSAATWTGRTAPARAASGASGAGMRCTPTSMRHRTSGSAVRASLVRCSRARRLSLPNSCAGSGSDGCGLMARVEPGAGVPPPTRDCPIPTSLRRRSLSRVGRGQPRLGCQVRPPHQI